MKRLMYLSISVFFLALTLMVGVHIGQQTAGAEPPQKVVGFGVDSNTNRLYVLLSNGDVYAEAVQNLGTPADFIGNFWQ